MTKNYKHIILLIWSGLLLASPTMASFENAESTNLGLIFVSKDTLNPKEKDSTKTKKVNQKHLAHLQQMAQMRSGGLYTNKLTTSVHTSTDLSSPPSGELEGAVFRSFPSLDQKIQDNKNFNVSFTNREPEFTPEFIKANFDKNPVAEKLIKNAKGALDAPR